MRVLIACEFSGRVRDAFLAKGHDAISCDLIPTESPGPHYQGDVLDIINDGWDMMIAFPPCTYLCVSGNRWITHDHARFLKQIEAINFFFALWGSPIKKVVIENPIGVMSTRLGKPNQIIQPWEFGHPEVKSTCLWIRGLPLLIPTHKHPGKVQERVFRMGPSLNRSKLRSLTYLGIADAMAEQWG